MKKVRVIRRERFNATHRLFNPNWTDEKNEQVFGKCSNKNWHGHNYTLFVTVEGHVDDDTRNFTSPYSLRAFSSKSSLFPSTNMV